MPHRSWVVPQPVPPVAVPTYLIDGDCGFCRRAMARVLAHFPGTFRSMPASDADLAGLGLTIEATRRAGHFLRPRGGEVVISAGGQSWAALLCEQRGAWGLLGRAMRVPPVSWGANATYELVARNRHRFTRWP